MADPFDDPFDALRDAGRRAVVPTAASVRARGHQRQVRARVGYAVGAAAVVVLGVVGGVALAGGGTDKAIVVPATQTPTASPSSSPEPTVEPTASTTPSPTLAATPEPQGLRAVDWGAVTLPASVCALDAPVTLRDGKAYVRDDVRGYPSAGSSDPRKYVVLFTDTGDVPNPVYGALDGTEDAVLAVSCYNNGGTGGGRLQESLVVFSGATGEPRILGVVQPHSPSTPVEAGIGQVQVRDGRLSFREYFYRPSDMTCCPSGEAVSTWRWNGTAMERLSTVS